MRHDGTGVTLNDLLGKRKRREEEEEEEINCICIGAMKNKTGRGDVKKQLGRLAAEERKGRAAL